MTTLLACITIAWACVAFGAALYLIITDITD